MQAIDATIADAIERAVMRNVHGVLLDKSDIPGMQVVDGVFDVIASAGVNVPNAEQLRRSSHAIGPMYLRATSMSPLDRVGIVTHEGTHIDQFFHGEFRQDLPHEHKDLGGFAEFGWLYAVNPLARIRFELRAERARWEVLRALRQPVPAVADTMQLLFSYYALPNDTQLRTFAEGVALSNYVASQQAAPQSPVAIVVINELSKLGAL